MNDKFYLRPSMAVCIAILTKDNCPLYLTCENTEDSLKMHFLVHTSIDVIEEKLNSTKAANDPRWVTSACTQRQ